MLTRQSSRLLNNHRSKSESSTSARMTCAEPYFVYHNFSFPPYTINGTPYPGGTITGTDTFFTEKYRFLGLRLKHV